jgi:Fe-S cluster biogenesis protein NfuA
MTLIKKDVNIGLVASILGEATPKSKQQKSTYNQNNAPYVAPVAPQVRVPVAPPQAPVVEVNGACKGCGHVNISDAMFCASCGTKLK